MLVSSLKATPSWELWILGPNGYAEPVQACGMYREYRAAEHAAGLLTEWLHIGEWNENVLDNRCAEDGGLCHDDARDLLCLRESLYLCGADPARVRVEVRLERSQHDNADSVLEAGWLARAGNAPARGRTR